MRPAPRDDVALIAQKSRIWQQCPSTMPLHPLEEFLSNHSPPIGKTAFARLVGMSPSALSRLFTGKRRHVGADACLEIVKATNGKVTLDELLRWKPPAEWKNQDGRHKPRRTAPRRRSA
ncbi:MAG: helix-turn-helix domain-containing protein [Deltaproteobacteria bacterium]|nr:helix-turn-helix domain-containing protein [Deltaproteobacteria bacterium]